MATSRFLSPNHQAVLDALLEIVQPRLGTAESTKCVVEAGEEDNAVFIRDTAMLLKSLHLDHPVAQLVVEVCSAHKDLCGCGVKSLLFLVGTLSKTAQQLRMDGIPFHCIESLMHEAVEDCIRELESIVVPVQVQQTSSGGQGHLNTASPAVPFTSRDSSAQVNLEHGNSSIGKTSPIVLPSAGTDSASNPSLPRPSEGHASHAGGNEAKHKGSRQSEVNRKIQQLLLNPARTAANTSQLRKSVLRSSRHFNAKNVDVEDESDQSSTKNVVHTNPYSQVGGGNAFSSTQPHKLSRQAEVTWAVRKPEPPVSSSPLILPKDAICLSHGSPEAMMWASKVMCCQHASGNPSKFDLNLVHTCSLDGRKSCEIFHGLVIHCDHQALETVAQNLDSPFRALLVGNDLTAEAKHKGFRQTLNATKHVGVTSLTAAEKKWSSEVLALLEVLNVNVVLVKGRVDAGLKDLCDAKDIAVLEMVPHHALVVLQTACSVELTTYILESTARNMCRGLTLKPLFEDWMDSRVCDKNYLVVTCPKVVVQTLIMQHPSPGWREVSEQEFWLCANRLAHAVKDMKVLPGGGVTESWCGHYLMVPQNLTASAEQSVLEGELSLYRSAVRSTVSMAFVAFSSATARNRAKSRAGGIESDVQSNDTSRAERSFKPSDSKRTQKYDVRDLSNVSDVEDNRSKFYDVADAALPDSEANTRPTPSSHRQDTPFSTDAETMTVVPVRPDRVIGQYDNYMCKISAWRSAVKCVCMVMKIDSVVTTGVDKQSACEGSVLL